MANPVLHQRVFFFGILQVLLQSMLMRHLNWFFTGSDEDGVLDSLGKSRAVCCGLPRCGMGNLELELRRGGCLAMAKFFSAHFFDFFERRLPGGNCELGLFVVPVTFCWSLKAHSSTHS